MRVSNAASGTLLDEVNALLDKAIEQRSSYVRLADRAARLYAPVVHLTALATFLGWLAIGLSWQPALVIAITVLIITCPCALGLAVPAVQVVAASAMFRRGLMLNSGDALERFADVDAIVFDKTGTLTLPQPSLANAADIAPEDLALAGVAGAGEQASARQGGGRRRGGEDPLAAHEFPGQGVTVFHEGKRLKLGSAAYCKAETEAAEVAARWPDASLIAFRGPERVVVFAVRQAPRPDARDVVAGLAREGYAIEILSGDRREAVEEVARELGIAQVFRRAQACRQDRAAEDAAGCGASCADGRRRPQRRAGARRRQRVDFADLGRPSHPGAGRRGVPRRSARARSPTRCIWRARPRR